jgi:hypothetical protein
MKLQNLFLSSLILCLLGWTPSLPASAQPEDNDRRFVMAVIPDTQRYAAWNIDVFAAQTQWIADHAAERDIRFTVHLGDITENDTVVEEWEGASAAMRILESAGLPYAIVPGNHDIVNEVEDDQRDNERELFPVYFPPQRSEDMSTYGDHSPNRWNAYHVFDGEGQLFLVLALDYMPSASTLAWAQGVLDQHPTLPVILVAHDIVTSTCELGDESCTDGGTLTTTGERLWNTFIFQNDQIFLTVNGHSWPPEHLTLQNAAGNDVHLILTNYQAEHYGGNGLMRLFEFDLDTNTISATTFSPWVLQKPENRRTRSDVIERTDPRNQFTIELDFAARFAGFSG